MERPLYAAVSVVRDGIYIYDIEKDCNIIKLKYYIYLGDECDTTAIVAFDGRKILLMANNRFYLVDINNVKQPRYADDNCIIPYEHWGLHCESSEVSTTIIPRKILGKYRQTNLRGVGAIYHIDDNAEIISIKKWYKQFKMGEKDKMIQLMKLYLDTEYDFAYSCYKNHGYYFVISNEYHLGIFKKYQNVYKPIWLCTDNLIHKKKSSFGQVRTVNVLDVPKSDDRWKLFENEIHEFIKDHIFQKQISNIIAEYI